MQNAYIFYNKFIQSLLLYSQCVRSVCTRLYIISCAFVYIPVRSICMREYVHKVQCVTIFPVRPVRSSAVLSLTLLFCSCDDVIEPNEIKLRPFVPLCGRFFLAKRFFNSVHPFQRYCLKTVSSAHRPTL